MRKKLWLKNKMNFPLKNINAWFKDNIPKYSLTMIIQFKQCDNENRIYLIKIYNGSKK